MADDPTLEPEAAMDEAPEGDVNNVLVLLEGYRLEDIPQEIWDALPEEAQDLLEEREAQRRNQLDMLAKAVTAQRDEAIEGRRASGIEEDWEEDQDAYEGVDDANRHESTRYRQRKPGAVANDRRKTDKTRSTVFLNITGPYTDAAAARVSEMLLPSDDQPYSIEPTPMPQLDALKASGETVETEDGQQVPVAELAKAEDKIARDRAKRAETRITDWLTEGQWHSEVREVVEDAARLGTGVLKGPMPEVQHYRRAQKGEDGTVQLVIEEVIAPVSKRVDPWNFYPDPACGDYIGNGRYVLERDWITPKQLQELAQDPSYLADQIRECLREGPDKRVVQDIHEEYDHGTGNDKYEVWYYVGHLTQEQMEAGEADLTGYEGDTELIPAIVTVVNDRVIKATLSHLESGEFPYDVLPWKRRKGMPWGRGVPRLIRTPQRMLNAATRAMMDNSGFSAIPQFVSKKGLITPADGNYALYPGKHWFMNEDADIDDIRKAMMSLSVETRQQELMNIIEYARVMAEEVTGLPQIMQGKRGDAPDTVGGMQILHNNANTVLRRLAKLFDDYITEPHLRRYYEWLMLYGEDNEEKGDYTVVARGSGALVERELQQQALVQMSQLVLRPEFGIDPQKWFREMARSQRLDPNTFMRDDDEPVIPPEIQEQIKKLEEKVAQYEGDHAKEQIRAEAQIQAKRIDADTQIQTTAMELQAENRQAAVKAEQDRLKAELDAQIAAKKTQIEELDKRIKDDANAIKTAELRLQKAALEHQIQQAEQQKREAEAERARQVYRSMAGSTDTGVMRRDRYGEVPYAQG